MNKKKAINAILPDSKLLLVRYGQQAVPYKGEKTIEGILEHLKKDKGVGMKEPWISAYFRDKNIKITMIFGRAATVTDLDE